MLKYLSKLSLLAIFISVLGTSESRASKVDCSKEINRSHIVKKVIYFKVGQSALSKEAQKKMDELFEVVNGNPSLKICSIGQADKQGDPDANKKLSLKRAQSAKNYLVKKGILKKQIETVFRGEAYGGFSLWGAGDKQEEDRRVEVTAYSE